MILDDKGLPEMMMVLHHNWDKGEVMISLLKCEGWIVGACELPQVGIHPKQCFLICGIVAKN